MSRLDALIERLDARQRRSRPLAVVIGVVKKFGEDRGSALAVELTYYGFLSLFPSLLILTTVLGFVGNEAVSDTVIGSTLAQFPVIGEQIGTNVSRPLEGSGIGLIIGILILLYGALGSAQALQHTLAQVWRVPDTDRRGFFGRLARGVLFFALLAVGLGLTAVLGSVVAVGNASVPVRLAGMLAAVFVNTVFFLAVFVVLTPGRVSTRAHAPGAVVGGVGYTVVVTVGTALVEHQLRHAEAIYGQFGLVLGLLAWLFLVARLSVYAAETNVVLAHRLWPRGLAAPPTDADTRARRSP